MADIEQQWTDWNKNKTDESFKAVVDSTVPIIDKAITSYAPGSSPAVKSQARILARKAMDSFDPSRGTKFQTHLYTQLQPLRRESASYSTVHTPERVHFDLRNVRDEHNRFVEENGREPNDDELADYTGISTRRLAKLRRYDRMVLGEGRFTAADDDENDGAMPETQRAASIWRSAVYDDLGNTDKLIFDLKTGRNGRAKELNVTQIAKKLKKSPSAISQRLKRIADKIAEGAEYE